MHLIPRVPAIVGALNTALAGAGLCATLLASPGVARAETVWMCALSDDAVRLYCVADVDLYAPAEATRPAARVVVRGVQFPLNPQRMYEVDLWGPPNDPDDLELLARAAMCYRSADCTATVGRVDWGHAPMRMRVAMRR